MSVPQIDESGMDPMRRTTHAAATPASAHDATPVGFEDMMAAISAMPVEVRARLADEADAIELGLDALELGSAYLERGDFERAERWLRVAARHHVSQAEQRLADLAELRQALAEIRNIAEELSLTVGAYDKPPADGDAAPDIEDLYAENPYAEARRIIAEAERKAAGIVAAAKLRTRRPSDAATDKRVEPRPVKGAGTWQYSLSGGAPLYVSSTVLGRGIDLAQMPWRSTSSWIVRYAPGSGKSSIMARDLVRAKANGRTVMLLILDSFGAVSGHRVPAHPTRGGAWTSSALPLPLALSNMKIVGVGAVGSVRLGTSLRALPDCGFDVDLFTQWRQRLHDGCAVQAMRERGVRQGSPLEETVAAAWLELLEAYFGLGRPPSIGDDNLLVPTVRPGPGNDLYVDLVPHWPTTAGEPALAAPHDHVEQLQVQGK